VATDPSVAPAPPPLPASLPVPEDDGAADHLVGAAIPPVRFQTTRGPDVDLHEMAAGRLVLFVFPRIGRPDRADPVGWDDIPGARGCTQQSCAYRDLIGEFMDAGYRVAGLSAQPTAEHQEAAARLHLPFHLLADPDLKLRDALRLPVFSAGGMTLYRRLTLVAEKSRIVKAFYPVFPPQENAQQVLDWIRRPGGLTVRSYR
jgi:peroxiredoxin